MQGFKISLQLNNHGLSLLSEKAQGVKGGRRAGLSERRPRSDTPEQRFAF